MDRSESSRHREEVARSEEEEESTVLTGRRAGPFVNYGKTLRYYHRRFRVSFCFVLFVLASACLFFVLSEVSRVSLAVLFVFPLHNLVVNTASLSLSRHVIDGYDIREGKREMLRN